VLDEVYGFQEINLSAEGHMDILFRRRCNPQGVSTTLADACEEGQEGF
jgi:hypothetical protein